MQHEVIKINYQLKLFFPIIFKSDIQLTFLTLLSPVESPSYHNGFSLNLEDKKNGVATNLFCIGVIGHRNIYLSIKIKIN